MADYTDQWLADQVSAVKKTQPIGSQRYKEQQTAIGLGQQYTTGQAAGSALKTAAGITGYNFTGPLAGQRYAEYQAAARLGQKYTPGQKAGTAQAAADALKAGGPVNPSLDTTPGTLAAGYSVETDPYYTQALAAGQSQFNYNRFQALSDLQKQQIQAEQDQQQLSKTSAESRRRLAGNYAARGMAGGAAGALTLAEAEANANQITAQTSIKDQIAALNQNFLQTYGSTTPGSDWTGTLAGQQYKTSAIQQALQARLAGMGM